MLFLNNLTKLEIIIDDENSVIEVRKNQIDERKTNKADYKNSEC